MRSTLLTGVALLGLALAPGAFAAGGGGGGYDNPPQQAADPDYTRAKAMIEAKNYTNALPILKQLVARDPKNADAYTLIGYATRKLGDANGSLQYYNTALSLDPKHIGAHEYIGEAYLMLDRPKEAEQQLARLDSICIFGCTEYRMLKTAIANYKQGKKPTN
jgi:predicted Zn-dependent protease